MCKFSCFIIYLLMFKYNFFYIVDFFFLKESNYKYVELLFLVLYFCCCKILFVLIGNIKLML